MSGLQMLIDRPKDDGMFNCDFCEKRCPICTRARQGKRWAKFLQTIEVLVTFGGCPWGRARRREYGVEPNEPFPPQDGPRST